MRVLKTKPTVLTLFLAAICIFAVIFLVIDLTPDTFGARFDCDLGYRLPRHYDVLENITPRISTQIGEVGQDHFRFVAVRIGQDAATRWHKVGSPWSDTWRTAHRDNNSTWLPLPRPTNYRPSTPTIETLNFDDVKHRSRLFSREVTHIKSDTFFFDYTTHDGGMWYQVMLLSVDDGVVCYFWKSWEF